MSAREDKDEAAKKVRSLGWLTESAMPRKRAAREINLSDGNSSAVGLKAAMLQAQAEAKIAQDDPTLLTRRISGRDIFKKKNKGIDDRNRKDLALNQAEASHSNKQLLAKAALYDKMKRGLLNHSNALIDFEAKGLDSGEMITESMEEETERLRWEKEAKREIMSGIALSNLQKDRPTNGVKQKYDNTLTFEEKEILSQVSKETVLARKKSNAVANKQKTALEKRKKQLLAARKRKKLSVQSLFKKASAPPKPDSKPVEEKAKETKSVAKEDIQTSNSLPTSSPDQNENEDDIRKGRDGEILRAYEYRPSSPDLPPESRPNPHREYAAIAPPSSLQTQPIPKPKRRKFPENSPKPPENSTTIPEKNDQKEARSFLHSLNPPPSSAPVHTPPAGYPPYPPPYHGYPPYGYPSYQGYPPYPYGYPPAGYPSAGQPTAGYPTAGYPPAGYPSAGYPTAGYPTAGYPTAGYPTAGYPSSGYPSYDYGYGYPGQGGGQTGGGGAGGGGLDAGEDRNVRRSDNTKEPTESATGPHPVQKTSRVTNTNSTTTEPEKSTPAESQTTEGMHPERAKMLGLI
ncbi:hypothetical protein AAMO2058_001361400 [Amorphochlora amoebiformis]